MDEMAEQGLRTLVFAYKEVTGVNNYKDTDAEVFESGLTLLGITAIEDVLQDDVKQCIRDFREARIKVWMLTGDKGETA